MKRRDITRLSCAGALWSLVHGWAWAGTAIRQVSPVRPKLRSVKVEVNVIVFFRL